MADFNRQQAAASRPEQGIHLVIAGPGTGKTRTMIERIRNTVTGLQVRPENILILTFSRKAADEIRERLGSSTGSDYSSAFAGTFHSFCLRILMDNSESYLLHTGMASFPRVIDSELEDAIMKKLFMKDPGRFMGIPYDAVTRIMNRQRPFAGKTAQRIAVSGLNDRIDQLREEYRQYKHEHSLIDYSDMAEHAAVLLASNNELAERLQAKYRFIFIDEFQDTSRMDFSLISLVAGRDSNVFMVIPFVHSVQISHFHPPETQFYSPYSAQATLLP